MPEMSVPSPSFKPSIENASPFAQNPDVDEILERGINNGRPATHRAVARARIEASNQGIDLTPGALWRRLRKLKNTGAGGIIQPRVAEPEDEQILRAGYAGDSRQKSQAIQEVRKRHPDWSFGFVWRLAKRLGLRASTEPSAPRRRWAESDTKTLLDDAGEKSVRSIAEKLGRTPNAVRCRLAGLGKSGRVTAGFSRRWIAAELHVGFRSVGKMFLAETDPLKPSGENANLILSESIRKFVAGQEPKLEITENLAALLDSANPHFKPDTVARAFNVPPLQVKEWVAEGLLKLKNERISEDSFFRYCRTHALSINHDLMEAGQRQWLEKESRIERWTEPSQPKPFNNSRRHVLISRRCRDCDRTFHGNGYFGHTKMCGKTDLAVIPAENHGQDALEIATPARPPEQEHPRLPKESWSSPWGFLSKEARNDIQIGFARLAS